MYLIDLSVQTESDTNKGGYGKCFGKVRSGNRVNKRKLAAPSSYICCEETEAQSWATDILTIDTKTKQADEQIRRPQNKK